MERQIFEMGHEGGVRALREWVFWYQGKINREWPGAVGEDLVRLQGEAKLAAKLIKLIDVGPSVKPMSKLTQGG